MSKPHDHPIALAPHTAIITIGVDGRLYFQYVTAELLAVAATVCPQDPALRARQPRHLLQGEPHERVPGNA
ncbi:MAG TPA: hypothetical protein P5572_13280 [Phycisphaerae bacterium]|nr:hypothetical protein [Phycisphaerales bacterium]HRX85985.1 hypothetical protein [Phycisphaerae bacterium]